VEEAREAFPHLRVLARAYDRRHAYELLGAGAHHAERETFEAALNLAIEALRGAGYRAHQAERAAKLFRRHDLKQFEKLAPVAGDEDKYVLAVREASGLMERLLQADLQRTGVTAPDDGWDTATLNAELRERAADEAGPAKPAPQNGGGASPSGSGVTG
jgi:glutathione-regulated potassium-efflux system ancillary protein KefC/glutathione-regulated potassium-efflux system protein KefB